MKIPTIGSPAPAFKAPDQTGATHTLADYRGKWLLLYFYPRDNTPGCTTEALTFESKLGEFEKRNAVVVGVSTDTPKSHAAFCEKQNLSFTLLADPEKKIVEAYGVWVEKKFLGKKYHGTSRTSFLINPKGVIERVYEQVKPPTHAAEVLADLDSIVH